MKSRNILISAIFLLVIIIAVFIYSNKSQTINPTNEIPKSTTKENFGNNEPPVFVWKFEEDDSLNLDGNHQTNIFLEAKYPDGVVQRKLIDTTPGSCNNLPDSDEDILLNSSIIQCYSAGLGYRFKITKGEESYIVSRKTFEEAMPDYNPPSYKYEVVLEFPFSN